MAIFDAQVGSYLIKGKILFFYREFGAIGVTSKALLYHKRNLLKSQT